jgi:hypothetical protein
MAMRVGMQSVANAEVELTEEMISDATGFEDLEGIEEVVLARGALPLLPPPPPPSLTSRTPPLTADRDLLHAMHGTWGFEAMPQLALVDDGREWH